MKIEHLHQKSTILVEWECKECSKIFQKSPYEMSSRKTTNGLEIICQKCCRLRAGALTQQRGISFLDKAPEESKEFVRNLDNPHKGVELLSFNSRDLCEWKCVFCSETWESRACNRTTTLRGPGCLKCRKKMIGANHVSKHNGELLKNAHPSIFAQIISLIDYPNVNVSLVSSMSNQKAQWICVCGKTFIRKINRVVGRKSIYCDGCTRSGKSLFEFEVAELLSALTGLTIEMHHRKLNHPEVDLYVPSLDMGIQLDPYWSHYTRYENDVRILKELRTAYTTVIRVRQSTLPKIDGSPEPDSASPMDWAKAAATVITQKTRILTNIEIEAALIKGNDAWSFIRQNAVIKNGCMNEPWAKEFVKNLTHPGRKLEFTSKGCEDLCLWKCDVCGKEWESKIMARDHRITPHRGCTS